jgi:hypothetical protein
MNDSLIKSDRILKILKGKCQRIIEEGDNTGISLLAFLASNNGLTSLESLEFLKRKYGKENFERILSVFSKDAIIQTQDNTITFANFETLSSAISDLSKFVGEQIFNKRKKELLQVINRIIRIEEGKLLIENLIKFGNYPSLKTMEPIIGTATLQDLLKVLIDNEALFEHYSSVGKQKLIRYRFLPGLDELLRYAIESELDDGAKDALAFIYISQNIRSEGVLQSDCRQFIERIPILLVRGLIRENSWHLSQYLVTPAGEEIVKPVIMKRLGKNKERLRNFLDSVPPKLLKFLVDYYFIRNLSYPKDLSVSYYSCIRENRYDCVIKHPSILIYRDRIFEELMDCALATLIHFYVSTGGGMVQDLYYCITRETLAFLTEYCVEKAIQNPLTPVEYKLHRIFHFLTQYLTLQSISKKDVFQEEFNNYLEECGLSQEEIKEVLEQLEQERVISPGPWRNFHKIDDAKLFQQVIREKFLEPIVAVLCGGETGKVPSKLEIPSLIFERVIAPGQKSLANDIIEEWLQKFEGEVIGELMYIDKSTFRFLDMIPRGCGIKILIFGIKTREESRCLERSKDEARKRPYLKIVRIKYPHPVEKEKEVPFFHERWLATEDYLIDFGTDLKSETIGKNEHTIHVYEKAHYSPRFKDFLKKWDADTVELERLYGKGVRKETFFDSELM